MRATRSADRGQDRANSRKAPSPSGVLIAVSCADPARLSLLLVSAGRTLRRPDAPRLLEPLASSPLANGGGQVVGFNLLRDLDRRGELIVTWTEGQRECAFDRRCVDHIAAGLNVLIGIPAGREAWLQRSLPFVRIIRIAAGTDPLRRRLTPRETFARSVFSAARAEISTNPHEIAIEDTGDISLSIRVLAAAIEAYLPARSPPAELAAVPGAPRRPRASADRTLARPVPLFAALDRPAGLNSFDPTR